jgi:hypothetical protein
MVTVRWESFLRANNSDGARHDIHDGEWHMMTLTTDVDGQKGFALYLDGEEVNALTSDDVPMNVLGKEFEVHGGDPLVITNEMLLCGRGYDSAEETFPFHGRLAFLSMWDTRLTPDEINQMYNAVTEMGANMRQIPLTRSALCTVSMGRMQCPTFGTPCPGSSASSPLYGPARVCTTV